MNPAKLFPRHFLDRRAGQFHTELSEVLVRFFDLGEILLRPLCVYLWKYEPSGLESEGRILDTRSPVGRNGGSYDEITALVKPGAAQNLLTVGSITRDQAARWFPFLAERFRQRRDAIRSLTHGQPEFVFWIYPDGQLHDAHDSHLKNPPKGHAHIVHDEPEYGGFLRGRIVRLAERQLIVVYCREDALAADHKRLRQFAAGVSNVPLPIDDDALVVSDNGDIYGTLADVVNRAERC
jgi:hypothetical protein